MSFRVDPAAIRAAAVLCAAHADHLDVADRYHDRYSEVDWSQVGLVQSLNTSHHEFVGTLRSRLRQAVDVLRDSASGLRRAAEAYDTTDLIAAAAFDAVLPSPWPSSTAAP